MDEPGRNPEQELIEFVSGITDSARLRIEEKLPHGFVRLKVAEAERRQAQHDIRSVEDVVIELARNSRDAGARNVMVGFQKERGRYRTVTVMDDGCGIPADMHQLVFEPRVTSRMEKFEEDRYGVHGRGMALFSIKTRADSAVISSSIPGLGTSVTVTLDTEVVTERSDQASIPCLEVADSGAVRVGPGPHNVARALLELSVDCAEMHCYLGSFAEVLSTIMRARDRLSPGWHDAIWSETARMNDAKRLAESCSRDLGLPVSERNAYRVLAGEIAPLLSVYEIASKSIIERAEEKEPPASSPGRKSLSRTQRHRNPLRHMDRTDIEEISLGTAEVVEKVLARYYLKASGEPRVRWGKGKISVSLHVIGDDCERD